jgi:hypothetical protein
VRIVPGICIPPTLTYKTLPALAKVVIRGCPSRYTIVERIVRYPEVIHLAEKSANRRSYRAHSLPESAIIGSLGTTNSPVAVKHQSEILPDEPSSRRDKPS